MPSEADLAAAKAAGLHWHKKGGWARRFPGDANRTYFGRIAVAQAIKLNAAEENRRERGEAVDIRPAALTIREASNLFLRSMDAQYESGKISAAQRASYGQEIQFLLEAATPAGAVIVGKGRRLGDFSQLDAPEAIFRPLREAAMRRGIHAADKSIIQIRTFFDWCSRVRRFMPPAFFADAFDPPAEKEKRAVKRADRKAKGVAYWTPQQVREIVAAAKATSIHHYAQVLLTLNSGMGSGDLALLEDADVDLSDAIIRTERSKTLVDRIIPLWDITVDAMRASRAKRPTPASDKFATRFFLTKRGRPLAENLGLDESRQKERRSDSLKNWFYRMLNSPDRKRWKKKGIRLRHLKRHKGGYYTLRAVFATLARGHAGDPNLDAIIMGQKLDRAILENYLRGDLAAKLRIVVDHVREQLSL